jgi:hypothetical protein
MLNEDYREMLQCSLEEEVRFLLLRGPSPAHRRSGVCLTPHPCVACDAPSSAHTPLPFTAIPEPPRTLIFSSVRHHRRTQDLAEILLLNTQPTA